MEQKKRNPNEKISQEDYNTQIGYSKDSVINLLASDNYIVVNRSLIKILGLKETILLGELASEFNYYHKKDLLDEDGYFYSTIENVQENTTLSSYEQKKCLDNLSKRNIVDVKLKGIPAKRHIFINSFQLINLFANCLETSFRKNEKLDSEFLSTNNNNIKNNNKDNKEIYKEKKFIKPTLEEVKEYCLERQNGIDAENFIDFYESKGWLVGKNKMKDWKACIRTWERNRKPKQQEDIDLPDWFDKDLNEEFDEQEQNEMETILKELGE